MRFLLLAAVPIGVGLFLTFSRGAMLATGVGLISLIWMRSRVLGLALAIMALVAFVAFIPSLLELRAGTAIIPAPADFDDEISDSGRFAAMLSAFPVWRLDPLFGVGFGQYGAESAWFVGSSPATSSHDEYLSILAEQGIAGIILFGGIAGLAIIRIVRSGGWSRDVGLAPIVTFAAGWFIVEPLASLQTSGLFWLTMGAVGGVAGVAARALSGVPNRGDQDLAASRPAASVAATAR